MISAFLAEREALPKHVAFEHMVVGHRFPRKTLLTYRCDMLRAECIVEVLFVRSSYFHAGMHVSVSTQY